MTMSFKVFPRLVTGDGPTPENAALVASALNIVLADSFALYLKTKKFSRMLSGPRMRGNFLLLDEQATQIFETTDAMAERICNVDPEALRSIGDFARYRRINDDTDHLTLHAMFMALRDDNVAFADALRCVRPLIDEAQDLTSAMMLDFWTEEAERRASFLFETSRP